MKSTFRYMTVSVWAENAGVDDAFANQVLEYVTDNQIASIRLSGSETPLINIESLENFLDKMVNEPSAQDKAKSSRQQLLDMIVAIVESIGHKTTKRLKYINLYPRTSTNRVYAQLHLPKAESYSQYEGIFLVVPNGQDFDYPDDIFHTDAKLTDLYGDFGPNASWLRGDGIRQTTSSARLFHLALSLPDDSKKIGKVKALLEAAIKAR